MNMAVFLQILRYALIGIGTWVVSKGWTDNATVEWVVGGVLTIVPVVWGLWSRRPTAQIEQVAALPNVKLVVTDEATALSTPTPNITIR